MNLGLGNLIELKRQLLPGSLVPSSEYDSNIAAIGKGVAALFDQECNRKFARVAGEKDEFTADRRSWVLTRYPIEAVTTVERRDDMAGGWLGLTINDVILQRSDAAGILQFGAMQGIYLARLRVTYTGGFWFDASEDATDVQPVGSTALPGDLKEAWYLQCREVWNKIDRQGRNVAEGEVTTFVSQMLMQLNFVPQVEGILKSYVRYQAA